ncbi:aspartate aminotransferase family protein [Ferrovum myxofaciens]|jgi:hypothetical protein|uniref:hypothetical protein n=1 Tax=Ferrovum myxofaciens TaxID=416213 RepID=UPI00068D520B|nr:hypothetical protein [Ferrovum myxofaciens]
MNHLREEIGGYFGLDLPEHGALYPQALHYQSARSAIRAVLESNGLRRVWMPGYICDSVLRAVEVTGIDISTYRLDDSLYPSDLPDTLSDGEIVLYVNYFGLCQSLVKRLQTHYLPEQLIIDNSHALFAPHNGVLATIYSPRKFAGLPDGGLLLHSPALLITAPSVEDQGSFERMRYLLLRASCSAREGYKAFQEARDSLQNLPPLAMSRLTRRLICSIDWSRVRSRRRDNFALIAEWLNPFNAIRWLPTEEDIPLCYPLVLRGIDVAAVKAQLTAQNIFTATYWPDALPRLKPGSIEATLAQDTLFLPIDQRLDLTRVDSLGQQILAILRTNSFGRKDG